jgi:polysaccharide biosynthesis transport protein
MKLSRELGVIRSSEIAAAGYFGSELTGPPNAILVANTDDLLTRLWRRRIQLLAFVLAGTAIAVLISMVERPTYRSVSTVEVQGLNDNMLNTRDVDPHASSIEYTLEPYLQTQIKIFKSDSLIGRVVDRLKLQDCSDIVRSEGLLTRIQRGIGLAEPATQPQRSDLIEWASGNLTVRIPGQTRVLEIAFDAGDPKLAADFANTLVTEFNDRALESRRLSAQHTSQWLNSQLAELKAKVEKSEEQMQTYARNEGLMYTSEKDNVAEDRLRQLQESLSKAHEARVAEQSRYELVSSAPADSLPEVLDDDVLKEYQMRLTELRRQLAEIRPTLAPGHYKVQQLQAEAAEMQNAIERERANILNRIKNQYVAANSREKILVSNYEAQARLVSNQSQKAVQYNILKREVETNRQLYEAMLQKVKEVGITSAINASTVSFVDTAFPPRRPFRPNRKLYAAAGFGLGSFLGLIFALLPRRQEWHIDRTGDLTRQLGVPELGSLPLVRAHDKLHPVELLTWHSKDHKLAESVRATLVSVLLGTRGTYNAHQPRVLVLSSCAKGEGRTTIGANLAIALAEANHRTLIIDADLRNPRLHELFGIENEVGLSDILSDTKACETYAAEELGRAVGIPNLYLLPSGPQLKRNRGLLHSPRTMELMPRFRTAFDTIIIDTPPVLSFADGRTLAKLSDGVVFVIRAGQTLPDEVISALQRFAEDGTPVLGTVINGRDEVNKHSSGPISRHIQVPRPFPLAAHSS